MEYGSVIYDEFTEKRFQKLRVVENNALRTILGARKTSPISSLEVEAYIMPLDLRFKYLFMKWYCKLMHSPADNLYPEIGTETGIVPNNKNIFSTRALAMFNVLNMNETC